MAAPILLSTRVASNRPRTAVPPGSIFGHLTVIAEVLHPSGERAFLVRCDCGTEKVVRLNSLRSGNTKTCGCGWHVPKHGHWRSPTYMSWASMISRCAPASAYTKHVRDYSGRGINIDPRWRQFENFLADMDERPKGSTLERIDNSGNYVRDNCRWATPAEQMRNTRRTLFVIVGGEKMCLMDASRSIGVKYATIRSYARSHVKSFQETIDHYIARKQCS